MEKDDIAIIGQLLTGMRDAVNKLEEAQVKKNIEKANSAKKEILNFQNQIDKLI